VQHSGRIRKVRVLRRRLASLTLPGCEFLFEGSHQFEDLAGRDLHSGYDPRGKDEDFVVDLVILA
jgi:hypothetical protein